MNAEFWRGKRVLVTGHTGFKGSWLALWLNSMRAEVIGYSLAPPTQPNLFTLAKVSDGIASIEGDILDLEHLHSVVREHQPTIVFHLAAQSLVRQSYRQPIETIATNVMGTANLLEASRNVASIKSIVAVTTDKCYENHEQQNAFKESDPLGGRDPYSSSKAAAELVTTAYRHSFFAANKQIPTVGVATARAGNVIGGGDWAADRLLPDIMRAISARKELLIRNPGSVRPWQHVLDPLRGYLLLAEKLFHDPVRFGQSWNFGPEKSQASPVSAVLDLIRELYGPELKWQRDESLHPHELQNLSLDSTKAKSKLGWAPIWDLRQSIAATIRWYRAYFQQEDLRSLTLEQICEYQSAVTHVEISRT